MRRIKRQTQRKKNAVVDFRSPPCSTNTALNVPEAFASHLMAYPSTMNASADVLPRDIQQLKLPSPRENQERPQHESSDSKTSALGWITNHEKMDLEASSGEFKDILDSQLGDPRMNEGQDDGEEVDDNDPRMIKAEI